MKFTVLLPTRNRLQYLKYAVETVRRQDYQDWEIIISDNNSEEDIAGYVRTLADSRIKYFRTETSVPVTDNWNNALEKSSGDYVIMLGDDDCLMKGYFTTILRLIAEFSSPDFIYTSAFVYVYPGAMPGAVGGVLRPYGYAVFLNSAEQPFLLEKREALELVRHTMNFRVMYGYNMQFTIINRKFIERLNRKGKFFQSPFPDYYASSAMFLKAERILICPYPLVTIGITPKSYGFYHHNKREADGIAFLNNLPDPESVPRLRRVILPGTNINTSWLFAADAVQRNYGADFDLRVNYRRYRNLQIAYVYEDYYVHHALPPEMIRELWDQTSFWERVCIRALLALIAFLSPSQRARLFSKIKSRLRQFPADEQFKPKEIRQQYQNILEVFEQVNPRGA